MKALLICLDRKTRPLDLNWSEMTVFDRLLWILVLLSGMALIAYGIYTIYMYARHYPWA